MQLQLRGSRSMEPKSVDEDDIGLRHLRVLSLLLEVVQVGSPETAGKALDLYHGILRDLADAYRRGDMEDAGKILDARQQMIALDEAAEQLAANGIGIPFF